MSDMPPPPPDDSGWSSEPPPPPPDPPGHGGASAPGSATLGTGDTVELGSLLARLGGRLIDIAIVAAVSLILFLTLWSDAEGLGASILFSVSSAAIGILYEVTMIANLGQTVGKMVTKIRVARADNGGLPGWSKSGVRWILPAAASFIPYVGFLAWLLVYCSLLWHNRRQGWHDLAAGTLVIKA